MMTNSLSLESAYSRDPVLSCVNTSRWFGGLHAMKNVSFESKRGEILGLVGPNGSGKTTTVNAITGFFPPQEGEIWFGDVQLNKLLPHQVAQQGIARNFQNVALFKGMRVLDHILLGRHHFRKRSVERSVGKECVSTCSSREWPYD